MTREEIRKEFEEWNIRAEQEAINMGMIDIYDKPLVSSECAYLAGAESREYEIDKLREAFEFQSQANKDLAIQVDQLKKDKAELMEVLAQLCDVYLRDAGGRFDIVEKLLTRMEEK